MTASRVGKWEVVILFSRASAFRKNGPQDSPGLGSVTSRSLGSFFSHNLNPLVIVLNDAASKTKILYVRCHESYRNKHSSLIFFVMHNDYELSKIVCIIIIKEIFSVTVLNHVSMRILLNSWSWTVSFQLFVQFLRGILVKAIERYELKRCET